MSATTSVLLPSVLHFDVVSYNGYYNEASDNAEPGEDGDESKYPITNIFEKDPDLFHCSKTGNNFDLVLKYKNNTAEKTANGSDSTATGSTSNDNGSDDSSFALTHFVIRGPTSCTAPIRTGIVFVHKDLPDVMTYTKKYDSITKAEYEALDPETLEKDGATAFFTVTDEETLETSVELPVWKTGRFVHIKFISCFADDEDLPKIEEDGTEPTPVDTNIDVEYVGLIGYDGKTTPSPPIPLGPTIPGSLGVAKFVLGEWNQLHQDFVKVATSGPIIILFSNDPATDNAIKAGDVLRNLAKSETYSDHLTFFYYDSSMKDKKFPKHIAEFVGLGDLDKQEADSNQVVIVDMPNQVKYVYTADLNESSIKSWVDLYIAGSLEPTKKSAERPLNDVDPEHPHITVLTRNSFAELVLDEDKDVFVDGWAEWCPPCLLFAPIIASVSDILSDVPTLRIAKFDMDGNDPDPAYLPEDSIPILKLFPRANKAAPVTYDGPPLAKELITFLHANMKEPKFDLNEKVSKAESIDELQRVRLLARKKLGSLQRLFERVGLYATKSQLQQILTAAKMLDEEGDSPAVTVASLQAKLDELTRVLQPLVVIYDVMEDAQQVAHSVMSALSKSTVLTEDEKNDLQTQLEDLMNQREAEQHDDEEEEEGEEQEGPEEADKEAAQDSTAPSDSSKTVSAGFDVGKFSAQLAHLKASYAAVESKVKEEEAAKEAASAGSVVKIHAQEEFDSAINSNKLVVIDFTAVWCGPCKRIKPVFGALSLEYPNVTFLSVDVDDMAEIAAKYKVNAMPTFVFSKNGEEIGGTRIQGADERSLAATIKKLTRDE